MDEFKPEKFDVDFLTRRYIVKASKMAIKLFEFQDFF